MGFVGVLGHFPDRLDLKKNHLLIEALKNPALKAVEFDVGLRQARHHLRIFVHFIPPLTSSTIFIPINILAVKDPLPRH